VIRWRRVIRILAALALLAIAAALLPSTRRAALQRAGAVLVSGDAPGPADLLAMDVESGAAGLLMIGDLHRAQPAAAVGILEPRSTRVDAELSRRRIVVPDVTQAVLGQLGIPSGAIVRIPAGEGGTTDTTAALGEWARRHPGTRVLVVVGPSHGRRFRRALRRSWPEDHPAALVVTTPYALFRADDWWQSRTTLREGLVELEKLALDYLAAASAWR
jgi:hypothetical protein